MHHLSDIKRPVESEFKLFEQLYADHMSSSYTLLGEVLEHIRQRSGKRLRPLLVLLCSRLCGSVSDKTLQTAVAMEMLHTASLVHDDVVDNSPLRRGLPSVNAQWNNKVAVLVGDYLFAHVLQIMAELRNNKIVTILAAMSQDLVSGELVQLHANESMWIDEKRYFEIIEHKTARLFAACAEAGAEATCATVRQVTAMRKFGLYLGLCFQLKDDMFDYSDSEDLGKPTMSDIRDGKVTLPLLAALQRAPKQEAEEMKALAQSLANGTAIDAADTEQTLLSFVMRYQGIRYTMQRILAYKEKAIQCLEIFRDCSAKDSLMQLLDYAIYRTN